MKKNYIGPKTLNYAKKVEKALKKKSLSTLKGDLQKVFNEYIRLRDTRHDKGTKYFVCISCETPKALTDMNAGHYWSVGGFPSVRYDEDNVHGQCIYCNCHQHGNLIAYNRNIIQKIGSERYQKLEIRAKSKSKLMAFEVEYLINEYKDKIKQLKK